MDNLMTRAEVLELTTLTYVCLWEMMVKGTFPRSIIVTGGPRGKRCWVREEVEAWLQDKLETCRTPLKGDKPE